MESNKIENIIEISMQYQFLVDHNEIPDNSDSNQVKIEIVALADEFEQVYGDFDWDQIGNDYYETINDFANKKLCERFGA